MKTTLLAALMAASTIVPLAMPATAEGNPWMVRGRVLGVIPDESADLSTGGAALAGDVDINDQYVPELDITYFFNQNFAAELILAVTPHDVDATGITIPAASLNDATVELGDVWLLPPTLLLQYHFQNDTAFKPYVGAGVNATLFFNEDEGDVADGIDYDSSIGFALQAGFDYDLDGEAGGWALNADIKKVWINTDVTVDLSSALGPSLNAQQVLVDADVDIDPIIVGFGLGYKF